MEMLVTDTDSLILQFTKPTDWLDDKDWTAYTEIIERRGALIDEFDFSSFPSKPPVQENDPPIHPVIELLNAKRIDYAKNNGTLGK